MLTEYADWRWCLLVNIPVAAIAIALALPLVPESRAHGNTRYDVPGAIVVTAGLVSLVYGFTKAAEDGWDATQTLGFIAAGVALLAIFVVIELRSNHPLLPLRIILDRNRGGAYLASTLIGAGLFGAFLFLTFYFQVVLQYKPLEAGLASLPVTVGVLIAAGGASQLMPRVGAKPLMVGGAVLAAVAMLALTQIDVDTSFLTLLLPAQVILGMGLGFTFVPLSSLALVGVPEHDAGRGQRDAERHPADRRLARHCPAEHHVHQRGRRVPGRSGAEPGQPDRGSGARLPRGVRLGCGPDRARRAGHSDPGEGAQGGHPDRQHRAHGLSRPTRLPAGPPRRGASPASGRFR